MTFNLSERAAASIGLQSLHYEFPRSPELREAFMDCLTDYYAKAEVGGQFEARGLLVTGESRVGKTTETKRLIEEFNASNTAMPDGRAGKIIYCKLAGSVTWKDLGRKTLEVLGYPAGPRRTQSEVWQLVRFHCQEHGVIGIYYDECQHVFGESANTNRIFLDSFKAMMKEPQWPLVLVLSGVPVLARHVTAEEQLAHLLTAVHFDEIRLGQNSNPTKDPDMIELNKLVFAYADHAEIELDDLVDVDFLERLDFACFSRWGLVIELLIKAFARCRRNNVSVATIEHFENAFDPQSKLPRGLSPFTAPDYRDCFDQRKLMDLLHNVPRQ